MAAERPDEELRSLDRELTDADELRGQVRPAIAEPQPGELGALETALIVGLGQGGAATALATVLIAWLRTRVGSVSVKLTRSDKVVLEVNAAQLRGLSAVQVLEFTGKLAADLDPDSGPPQ
ncbi:effector-associated constant component EACC1 [Nocardia beijingensis]|uniref:effector-associated constant component EACC1 n=1 Tax=Nocardia beijingensis TaxID=95162 RepID=UPI0012F4EBE5|nr:hypothetical protein [Nocardia beijingensis]